MDNSKKTTAKLLTIRVKVLIMSLKSAARFLHPIMGRYTNIMLSKVQQKQLQNILMMEQAFSQDIWYRYLIWVATVFL